ncbi:DNA ligase [Ferriphaselus sp. R-1]|uniref:DNA ligase n=1 Tax=Ferriphaselus sp. R-1 TaxID=1485544 RepID=UPI00054E8917|nr:DNA ligase [Ferriphaselus sp. R-1]
MNRFLAPVLFALALLAPFLCAAEPPPLMLANVYHADIDLAEYLVSEKYDGVRGYWDGERLLTRGGEAVHAPDWFTAGWPKVPLDGELWVGRGRFAAAVSTVRQQQPDETGWRRMRFMVFDLPTHPGTFAERDRALAQIVNDLHQPWVVHVEQSRVADPVALRARLQRVVQQGGEGLVLHRSGSRYRAERNDDLLKLKLYEDAEARVIGYLPGKGKYAGMTGALEVETPQGLRFRLGAGLSDTERRDPPALGSWVTYRYNGVNEKTGIPRFARFLRVRPDFNP